MDRNPEIRRILTEIRRRIKQSDLSQRKIEARAGFSKGYLSQLLASNLDLKVWHVLAILEVLGGEPGEFFDNLYPIRRASALEEFRQTSEPLSKQADRLLDRLYQLGIESLQELRGRVELCENAVVELRARGLLGDAGSELEGRGP